jgi:hypothetical protein
VDQCGVWDRARRRGGHSERCGSFENPIATDNGVSALNTGEQQEVAISASLERISHLCRQGFQIWINVPSAFKMADPRYGTVEPEAIPIVQADGAFLLRLVQNLSAAAETLWVTGTRARLLAGPSGNLTGLVVFCAVD